MHPGEYTDYGLNGRTRCPNGSLWVHGALVVRQEYEGVHYDVRDGRISEDIVNNGWINYAKGFQMGFDTFEADYVDKPNMLSNTLQDKVQRVLDYLSYPLRGGFTKEHRLDEDRTIRYKWYENGIEYGRLYHAWYIVLSNHHLFEAYFEHACKIPPSNNANNVDKPPTEDDKAKSFPDYLECGEDQKPIIVEKINLQKQTIKKVRGWCIVLLALDDSKLIDLSGSTYNKNDLYKAFNGVFELNYTEKAYNDYITPYKIERPTDGKREITKSEIDEMKQKTGVNGCV